MVFNKHKPHISDETKRLTTRRRGVIRQGRVVKAALGREVGW